MEGAGVSALSDGCKAQKAMATKKGHGLKRRCHRDIQPIDRVMVGLDRGEVDELECARHGHDPALPDMTGRSYCAFSRACARVRQTTQSDLATSRPFSTQPWHLSFPKFPQVSRPEHDAVRRSCRWFPTIQSYLPCTSPSPGDVDCRDAMTKRLLPHAKAIALSSSASRSRMARFGLNDVAGARTTVSCGASVISVKSRNVTRLILACSIGSVAAW